MMMGQIRVPSRSMTGAPFILRRSWSSKSHSENALLFESTGNYQSDAEVVEDANLPLYQHQVSLPRLPVPLLEETVQTFLPTALPLAETKEEAASLQAAVAKFPQQAAVLQQRLLKRRDDNPNSSWLSLWWNQLGYLQVREPNVIGVSYLFRLADDPIAVTGVQRAAAVLDAALEYALKVTSGQKEADVIGRKNPVPLCSSQYKYLFHACRIPGLKQDTYKVYRPCSFVAVACRGQFYRVPLVDKGQKLSRGSLQTLLQECIRQSEIDRELAIGWLTTSPRDTWAATYQRLVAHKSLQQALETLQSSLLLVCLDVDDNSQSHLSDRELSLRYWHGNVTHSGNRWFDKSIQLVISDQGHLGVTGEHSMADGMPAVGFCDYLLERGRVDPSDTEKASRPNVDVSNIFSDALRELSMEDRQELERHIDMARKEFTERIGDHDLQLQHYKAYGSMFMKQAGFSPDAYVQMAMQVASYRLFGKQVGTYESVQTRFFLHGRTETNRTVSPASAAFCRAMGAKAFMTMDEATLEHKRALLREAVDSHVQYLGLASKGLGVDRHFLGLSLSAHYDEPLPDLFSHPLYLRSKRWRLSTSTLPNTAPGFGPVEEDGVGVGYDIRPDSCIFTITAKRENGYAEKLHHLIEEALDELRRLVPVEDLPISRL